MTALTASIEAHRQQIRDSYTASIAEAIEADADTAEALTEQLATREEQWRREDEEAGA